MGVGVDNLIICAPEQFQAITLFQSDGANEYFQWFRRVGYVHVTDTLLVITEGQGGRQNAQCQC